MTVLEVLVALMLVAVGLLGIAGSSSLAMRAVTTQSMTVRAAARARLRVALLEAAGCEAAADGTADDATLHLAEHWQVVTRAPGRVTLDDSLAWVASGSRRHLVIRTALLC